MGQWVLILALPRAEASPEEGPLPFSGALMANAMSHRKRAWFQCLQTWNHGTRFPDDLNPTINGLV